jgi:methylaspartate mutase sigma subunit
METCTVIVGVIGADVHTVGSRILEHVLTEAGFKVVHLGAMVSQEEFIKGAIETDAKAILVSSLYGHAEIDCRGFRENCVEAGLNNTLLYIGGNLAVGADNPEEVEGRFKKMGFDRVYPSRVKLEQVVAHLRQDLSSRNMI